MKIVPPKIVANYKKLAPRCYAGVPNDVYHASNGINNSSFKHLVESPASYIYYRDNPDPQTSAMVLGSAFHDCVLLFGEFVDNYLLGPTKGKTTKAWKEFKAKNPGNVILTPDEMDAIVSMKNAIYDNPYMGPMIDKEREWREVSVWARDPDTGLICRIRMDLFVDGWIVDLKTALSPHRWGFKKSVWDYKYFIQAPFYVDMARAAGLDVKGFKFFVVGKRPPYSTVPYVLSEEWTDLGRQQYKEALQGYADYLMDPSWDGLPYGREPVVLGMEE